jgi:hypothetical protein
MKPDLQEIIALTKGFAALNKLTQDRLNHHGIDLDQPPLTKSEVKTGETLYDQKGRPWLVGKSKKMIPPFNQIGIMGVQDEIIQDQPYPFDSEIAQWRRPKGV